MLVVHIKKHLSLNLRPTAKLKIYCDGKMLDTLIGNHIETDVKVKKGSSIWVKHQWCGSNKLKILEGGSSIVIESFLSDKLFVLILSLILLFTLSPIFAKLNS